MLNRILFFFFSLFSVCFFFCCLFFSFFSCCFRCLPFFLQRPCLPRCSRAREQVARSERNAGEGSMVFGRGRPPQAPRRGVRRQEMVRAGRGRSARTHRPNSTVSYHMILIATWYDFDTFWYAGTCTRYIGTTNIGTGTAVVAVLRFWQKQTGIPTLVLVLVHKLFKCMPAPFQRLRLYEVVYS